MEREDGENSVAPLQTHGGRPGNPLGARQTGTPHLYASKFVKLEFPRFNGEGDTTSWICRVEQFFQFHQTPEEDRVPLASFHLEGGAQLWYQLLKQEEDVMTWKEFTDGLHARYGPTQFQDFFGELTKLQQVGSVRDYQTQFEKLLSKVGQLPQNRQVSCFISGLKDSIKADVLSGRPKNLSSAIGLARLYEARNISQRRTTPTADLKKVTNKETTSTSSTLPVRRMSPTELQERRAKGLCYNCNEKFVPGHRCKKLFLIEACHEEEDGDVIMDMEESVQEDYKEVPEISLHAISGTRAPETMRVKGGIGHISTIVLVDSGSTHNFINETLARKVALQPEKGGKFEVVVASGEKLSSPGKCTNVKLILQGIPVLVDFYLLPLEGYDIVLGTQWLSTLGPILWDFAKLQMRFKIDDKEVSLQGMSVPKDQIIGDLQFSREFKKSKKGVLLQLFTLGTPLPKVVVACQPPPLQQILEEFQDVFEEPKGLPPPRAHDHKIPLMEGSGPVCVKPYRYPHYQKAEIEKLVAGMLSTGGRNLLLSTYEKEVLALVLAVQKWRAYLLGKQFIVRTDQRSLKYLWEQRITTTAQQRWLYKLMGFDFVIEYKKGKENIVADALSRREDTKKVTERNKGEFAAITQVIPNWVEAIKEEVKSNSNLQMLVQHIMDGEAVGPWEFKDGVIFFKERIYLAENSSLINEILSQFHNSTHEGEDGILVPKPQAVLDRRVRKKKDEVLIHWQGLSPAEATWEDLVTMKQQFPEYCLEDKAAF
ncbi:hypothetical protein F0562_023667 [Nyssa sinensis]|uniref:Chromo domain-containing protein n=1 Tax=Nyssa sinensis TaxID=561372 RepID=A0A5J5BHC7_9ASTE|nr:hypothetical protein F0562_023667 [Nyssa sinensis]